MQAFMDACKAQRRAAGKFLFVAGKANISESTYTLVKKQFSRTCRGKRDTMGKDKVDMYFAEEANTGA
ncbi:MAG: hypothetical protein KDC61_16000 [Saprospiraceae bacterium]|nr:hypothetical protein [Saprospiraceae bacterium]